MSNSLQPYGLYSSRNSPGQNTGVGCLSFPSPGNLPNSAIKPRFSTLQMDSLPAEPSGKSKNTGVGSMSLLQGIFLSQELNRGLLHCRRILYQVSYKKYISFMIPLPKSFRLIFNIWIHSKNPQLMHFFCQIQLWKYGGSMEPPYFQSCIWQKECINWGLSAFKY